MEKSNAIVYTEATDSTPQPSQGPAGPCPECGAPYRHDQRYCLQCGAAVGEAADGAATVDFAPPPSEAGAPPSSPPPHLLSGSPKPAGSEPSGSPTTVIAAVGVLLLAIGVGVLIGRTGSGGSASNGSPQVITVGAPTTSTSSTETTSTSSTSSGAKHHAKAAGSSKETGSSGANPAPPSVVKKLNEKGGGSYEQKSNNLPNVISTG